MSHQVDALRALVSREMDGVDALIRQQLNSPVGLINELGQHIIKSGGKRLRPMVTLLSAKAMGYEGDAHILLAAILEFIHTATLLHDDVVDASQLRRGEESANALWGNEASILVGDYLFSMSFQLMVRLKSLRVLDILAGATSIITQGEVQQLMNQHNPHLSEEDYMQVIQAKTAMLFQAATESGAVVAGRREEEITAMAQYGLHLGTAFQLVDDALDYEATSGEMGKNPGDDLAEGKATLPLIHIMQQGTEEEKSLVEQAIRQGSAEAMPAILKAIDSTGAIAYTHAAAQREAKLACEALQCFPDTDYRQGLEGLAAFAVARTY